MRFAPIFVRLFRNQSAASLGVAKRSVVVRRHEPSCRLPMSQYFNRLTCGHGAEQLREPVLGIVRCDWRIGYSLHGGGSRELFGPKEHPSRMSPEPTIDVSELFVYLFRCVGASWVRLGALLQAAASGARRQTLADDPNDEQRCERVESVGSSQRQNGNHAERDRAAEDFGPQPRAERWRNAAPVSGTGRTRGP